jgi:Uma2 family endonuclease
MARPAIQLPLEAMTVELKHRLFTVDEYYRMAEAGILNEDDCVELIDGEIVHMPPIGSNQASVVDTLARVLSSQLRLDLAIVRVQNPVRLNEHSEMQPDIAAVRPREDRYKTGHPGTTDVFLLIEVAESSVAADRQVKVPRYARAEVPEVWLIDLNDQSVEIFMDPSEGEYRTYQQLARDDALSLRVLQEVSFQVEEVLG